MLTKFWFDQVIADPSLTREPEVDRAEYADPLRLAVLELILGISYNRRERVMYGIVTLVEEEEGDDAV